VPIFVIPFAVFFVCVIVQFVFVARVRQALAERHPDVLHSLTGTSFFATNGVYKFVRQRGDRALNDPELTQRVQQFKWLMYVTYGAWGLVALGIITGVGDERLTLHGLAAPAHAAAANQPAAVSVATTSPSLASGAVPAPFDALFGAAFVGNLIYLMLVWRLSERWNAQQLGPPATMGDPMSVMGVILWSAPSRDDPTFRRLRLATRAMGLLALAGTLTIFAVVMPLAFTPR
jgi:hypothetical protein